MQVFIQALLVYRMSRVHEVYGDTPQEARENIRHSDRPWAACSHHISENRWSEPANYNLVLDFSGEVEESQLAGFGRF